MILKIYFIIIVFIFHENSILSSSNKCCPENEKLNSTLNGCVSVYNISDIYSNVTNFKSDASFYNISSNVINLPCSSSKIKVLMSDDFVISDNFILTPKLAVGVQDFNSSEYCLDEGTDVDGKVALTCPCLRGTCVQVCCGPGQVLVENNETERLQCETAQGDWINWSHEQYASPYDRNYSTVFNTIHSFVNSNTYILYSINETGHLSDPSQNLTIIGDGTFYDIEEDGEYFGFPPSNYCIGIYETNNETVELIVTFFDVIVELEDAKYEQNINIAIYTTLFILGALFLLATLVVHILLYELRSTAQGLSLMLHCACMFVACIALAIAHVVGDTLDKTPCFVVAYTIQYSLLAGFFWINVMCINISMTFRSSQTLAAGANTNQRYDDEEFKKFLYYSIFAKGVPALISAVTIWANNNNTVPQDFQPHIGATHCWFRNDELPNHGELIYFYGPISIIILINLVLFILTAIKIFRYNKRQTMIFSHQDSTRHGGNNTYHKHLILFLKLFGVMGISWIMELVSWKVGGKASYWYVTDAINLLRSVYIFYMFCCTPEVLQLLKKKYT